MRMTRHFKREEFDCHDGTQYPANWLLNLKRLCNYLETIRKEIGDRPIKVISGYRTSGWNKKCGGAKRSYHLSGIAADIKAKGLSSRKLYGILDGLMHEGKIAQGGLGLYRWGVHYDTRGYKTDGSVARWNRFN